MLDCHLRSTRHAAGAAWVIAIALVGAGCGGDEAPVVGGDNRCGFADPDCLGCADFGACCLNSDNCPVAAICNLPSDPLFDPNAPEGTCLRVTCDSNADCDPPKLCTLEKLCKTPLCQVDEDCSAGDVCRAGACVAPPEPATATACEVVTRSLTLAEGASFPLAAIARDDAGAILPGIDFAWSSSDPMIAEAQGAQVVGVGEGMAVLTARVTGADVTCAGEVEVRVRAEPGATDVRVTVVDDVDGEPVAGASVLVEAGASLGATTDAEGEARFTDVAEAVASVTVIAEGRQYLTVLEPASRNLLVPLPVEVDASRAGGFRGLVDVSSTPRGNVELGFVGPALPANLLDFGLEALVGDLIRTEIDAPELGLELTGPDAAELPGGLMLALGNNRFTADAAGPRCQGQSVGFGQLGCFLARAPEGRTAGWAFAGRLELADVTPIASTLSDVLGSEDGEEIPFGELLVAILPLVGKLSHAIEADLDIPYAPTMGGEADYTRYRRQDLVADQPLGVLSVVEVPDLPRGGVGTDGGCADAAVLLAAAHLEGRGLVPLGIAAGLDTSSTNEAGDCRVNGVPAPFGEGSVDSADGQIPLAMAPLHAGAEGSDTFLLLVAADVDGLFSGSGYRLTALVERTPAGVSGNPAITGGYLPVPDTSIEGAARTISLASAVSEATFNRFELQGGSRTWLVYAPASRAEIVLPTVDGPDGVLSALSSAFVLSMRVEGSFSDVFTVGSGRTLDRLIDTVTAFSAQECLSTETARCRLR